MASNSATADAVFESLRSIYWSSITREVANLILAYREFLGEQDEPSDYESQTTVDGGPHFERFCSMWGKLNDSHQFQAEHEIDLEDPAPSTSKEAPLDTSSIHQRACEIANIRYTFEDSNQKRARSLLKALGENPLACIYWQILLTPEYP